MNWAVWVMAGRVLQKALYICIGTQLHRLGKETENENELHGLRPLKMESCGRAASIMELLWMQLRNSWALHENCINVLIL